MKKLLFLSLLLLIVSSCSDRTEKSEGPTLVSMQIIDRHGFSETISSKDRLAPFQTIDFLSPQAYNRVLRVYSKNNQGKSPSAVTSYHSNGQVEKYLEIVDGRAHGQYKEWHANGKLKLDVKVIEGLGDITEIAQMSWLFDGKSSVWNEEGKLIAEINYDKGALSGDSLYYHPNGKLGKSISYKQNQIDGWVTNYNAAGALIEKVPYAAGVKDGRAEGFWSEHQNSYLEEYDNGLLKTASYFDDGGKLLSEIKEGAGTQMLFVDGRLSSTCEFVKGAPDGLIKLFDPSGSLDSSFYFRGDAKNGEEVHYYHTHDKNGEPAKKLSLFWRGDAIQGVVKTWYENGVLESQREYENNKKHGLAFAWYESGDLMLMEEYKEDRLARGSYYKKGEKLTVSQIENGDGIATLYDAAGHYIQKITYEKGKPLLETNN